MSCSEYDLQGLHARIYLARETDGRLGEYQCLSPTFRSSNAFYTVLILLRQIALFSSHGRTGGRRPATVSDIRKTCTNNDRSTRRSYVVTTVNNLYTFCGYLIQWLAFARLFSRE